MSEEAVPPERDVKDFKFQQLCKIQVRDPVGADDIQGLYSLIDSSSKYGLIFVGIENGFKVIRTQEVINEDAKHASDRLKYVITDIPTVAVVNVGQQVTHLTVSHDGLTLAVCMNASNQSSLNMYDVRNFVEPVATLVTPFMKINLGDGTPVALVDMIWNPTVTTLLVTCLSNGRLDMYNITDKLEVKGSLPAAKARCVCWSPKGKQLVAGLEDGRLIQYDFELKEKRVWDYPPLLPDQSFSAISVVWLSTYTFLVGYISSRADCSDQPTLILFNGSKDGPVRHENFEDICFGTGEERASKYFFSFIQPWDIIISGSSNASEIAVVAKHLDQKQTWERWNLGDSERAECPLTEGYMDTYPLGMTVDFSSQTPIPIGDERMHLPSPMLLVLSTAGYVLPYHCMYLHREAPQINAQAELLTKAGCRQAVGVAQSSTQQASHQFGGTPTVAKNLFGTGASVPTPSFGAGTSSSTPLFGSSTSTSTPMFGTGIQLPSTQPTALPTFGTALGAQTETKPPFSGIGFSSAQKEGQSGFMSKLPAASQPEEKPSLFSGTSSGVFGSGTAVSTANVSALPGTFGAPQTSSITARPASSGFSGFRTFIASTPSTTQAASAGLSSATTTTTQTSGFGTFSKPATTQPFSFGSAPTFHNTLVSSATTQPQIFGLGTSVAQSFGSNSSPFTFKTTTPSSVATDAVGVKISSSSMMATGSFNFTTKTTGQMTGFNIGAPFAQVTSSKPTVSSSQAATTQPANPGLFGKGASGFAVQPAQSITNPAQTGSTGSSAGGFGVPTLNSGAKEKEGPVQSGHSSAAGGLHKSTTLSSLSQVTNPEPTAQAVSHEHVQSNEEENRANDTVDKSFAKSIQEEIQHFEKELLELKSRAGRSEFQIGTKEDMVRLRKKTEEMGKFCEDIKKTVQEQNKDVQEQTTLCLDMFAMMEECRVRQQLNSDPKYKNLLKARALDSGSAEKLQQLRLQNQALDQGLRDVDLILETQWEDYQNRKKTQARRVQAPTNDAIYRVVKSNLTLISAQKKKLKDMEERLKQLKLYNKTSTWNNSGLSRHSNGDTSNVLSSLADSLVDQRSQAPRSQTSSESGSLHDSKLAQLREHLYRRHVPVVRSTKPENLSMSRLTIPDTALVWSSTQSPQKPAVPQKLTGASGSEMEQIPASNGAGVFTGQPMGATGLDKKKQAQTFMPDSKPTTTKKTTSTTSGQKNGAVFTNAGPASFTFSTQQAASSGGQFQFNTPQSEAPTFQGYGMGPSSKESMLTMPKVSEINGIKFEDVTPSGSDNEVVTTEEDEEYDEDSSESNGQGFGAQYSMIDQLKPDPQITSTPVAVKTPSQDVSTPKPGASNTPVSRKLFSQEDSQATSTFQFGNLTSQAPGVGFGNFGPTSATPKLSTALSTSSVTASSSFSFSGSQSTGTKAPQSGFTFGAQQPGKSDPSVTAVTSQNSISTDKGFMLGTGTGTVFNFGQKATGTDTKAFSFAATTAAPSAASNNVRTASTAGTATLPTTVISRESSITGSDVISGSTESKSTIPVSSATASQSGAPVFGKSSASSASMSFGLQTSSVVSASKPAVPTTGGFGITSSSVISQPTVTASSESAGISTSVAGTLQTLGSSSVANQSDKTTSSATTGLFCKSTVSASSSACAGSPLGQPCTETASKLGALLSGTTSTSQAGTPTQATSTGIGQPESTSQPSAFSFGQSVTSTQPGTFGFGQSVTSTQTAPFSFGQSAVTAQSSTPQFGQAQTSTGGGSVSGLFGKPTTATGGTLFGQTATTSDGGLFGQTTSSSGLFGTQSSSTAGPFGTSTSSPGSTVSSSTGLFGAPASSSSGLFGTPATSSSGLFGVPATSSSGLFGAPATSGSGLFGVPATSSSGVFGAPATSSSGLFGAPATSSSGLFGSATSSSSFSFGQSASFGKPAFGQSSGFGQSPGFGQTRSEGSSGGLFSGLGGKPSAEKASSNVFGGVTFGSQVQSGSGLFGSNSSSTFGSSASTGAGAFSGGGGAFSGGGAGVGSTGFGATQQPSSGSAFGGSGFGGAPAFGGAPSFGSPPRFGSSPTVSGGSGFGGQPTFGSGSPLGGGTFGSASSNPAGGFAGFASAGSPTFGALAKSADAPSFGSLSTSGAGGFGSPGFGGGQQSQPAFGGNAFGSSPQFTGYRG